MMGSSGLDLILVIQATVLRYEPDVTGYQLPKNRSSLAGFTGMVVEPLRDRAPVELGGLRQSGDDPGRLLRNLTTFTERLATLQENPFSRSLFHLNEDTCGDRGFADGCALAQLCGGENFDRRRTSRNRFDESDSGVPNCLRLRALC